MSLSGVLQAIGPTGLVAIGAFLLGVGAKTFSDWLAHRHARRLDRPEGVLPGTRDHRPQKMRESGDMTGYGYDSAGNIVRQEASE